MIKNKIISDIFQSEEYDKVINNLFKGDEYLKQDLKQELFLILLEKDEELIKNLYETNGLKFYFTRIVLNQVKSQTSPFYTKYRQSELKYETASEGAEDRVADEIDEESLHLYFDIIDFIVDNKILTWWETEMFIAYYKIKPNFLLKDISDGMSYAILAKKLNLSRSNVAQEINKIKNKVFKQLVNSNIPNLDLDYLHSKIS